MCVIVTQNTDNVIPSKGKHLYVYKVVYQNITSVYL